MGTLAETITQVRLRVKDQYKNEFTDTDMVNLTVEVLGQVYETLRSMESNLLITEYSFNTVAGTSDYTLTGVRDIISGSIWIDKDNPLTLQFLSEGTIDAALPQFYTVLPSGQIRLIATPDAEYLVTLGYFAQPTVPTLAGLATYNLPWDGIWNRAIMRSLVVECLTILERGIGVAAAQAQHAWDEATMNTYTRGVMRRTKKGNFI